MPCRYYLWWLRGHDLTCGASGVRSTAAPSHCLRSCALSSSAGFLDLSAALAWIYLFHHTPSCFATSSVPTTVIHPRLAGYLHERGLSAARFVEDTLRRGDSPQPSFSAISIASVAPPSPSPSGSRYSETRSEIESSFGACPDSCLHNATRLVGDPLIASRGFEEPGWQASGQGQSWPTEWGPQIVLHQSRSDPESTWGCGLKGCLHLQCFHPPLLTGGVFEGCRIHLQSATLSLRDGSESLLLCC